MATVTVIIPVRNDRRVARALDSVLAQRLPVGIALQVIVVDDSDDDTPDVLLQYRGRVAITSTPGGARGVYAARNHGLTLARGDFVNFLGADDVYADPNVLSDVAQAFRQDAPDFVHGWVETVDATGKVVGVPPRWSTRKLLLLAHMIPDTATFWGKEVFRKRGAYREDLAIAGDYEFFLRNVVKGKARGAKRDRTLVLMESGGMSWSQSLGLDLFIARERRRAWRANASWQMLASEACFTRMILMGNLRRLCHRIAARLSPGR